MTRLRWPGRPYTTADVVADLSADASNVTLAQGLAADADRDYAAVLAVASELQAAKAREAALRARNRELQDALASLSAARLAQGYVSTALMAASDEGSRDRARDVLDHLARDRQLDHDRLLAGFDNLRAHIET